MVFRVLHDQILENNNKNDQISILGSNHFFLLTFDFEVVEVLVKEHFIIKKNPMFFSKRKFSIKNSIFPINKDLTI